MLPGLPEAGAWRGFHCLPPPTAEWKLMPRLIEWLATQGMNVLILQVDYRFAFRTRPDLSDEDPLSPADLGGLASVCAQHGMALIPQFNCLGHQSAGGGGSTYPLLRVHPEFDETPHLKNDHVSTHEGSALPFWREWCPSHSGVHGVVLPLIDEIVEACNASAVHVGLDEVLLIGDARCRRCAGKDRAELFAGEVNRLHAHISGTRGLQMMMWADRLIDGAVMDHGPLESSFNETAAAIDSIPRDVILCDWHYERRASYPSVGHFLGRDFRVLPTVWRDAEQARDFVRSARECSRELGGELQLLGTLFASWSRGGVLSILPDYGVEHPDRGLMKEVTHTFTSSSQ